MEWNATTEGSASKNFSSTITNTTKSGQGAIVSNSVLYLFFAVLLAFVAIAGNSLVIISYKVNKRLRTGTYTILASLAISDILVGGVSLPLWIYGNLNNWKEVSPAFTEIFLSFDVFSAVASIFHLTTVSIERFIAVSKPYYYYTLSKRTYAKALAMMWSVSLVIASLQPVQRKIPSAMNYYTAVILVVCFAIPLIVMSSVYGYIFRITRRILRSSYGTDRESRKKITAKELKAVGTLVIITGLFALAWLPFFTLTGLATFCPLNCLPDQSVLLWLVSLVKWMHYSNSACNPFVYAYRDAMMRETFHRLIEAFLKKIDGSRTFSDVRLNRIRANSTTRNSATFVST